jgi:hypothetical protein
MISALMRDRCRYSARRRALFRVTCALDVKDGLVALRARRTVCSSRPAPRSAPSGWRRSSSHERRLWWRILRKLEGRADDVEVASVGDSSAAVTTLSFDSGTFFLCGRRPRGPTDRPRPDTAHSLAFGIRRPFAVEMDALMGGSNPVGDAARRLRFRGVYNHSLGLEGKWWAIPAASPSIFSSSTRSASGVGMNLP